MLLLGLVVALVASCGGGGSEAAPADSGQPEVRFAPENGSKDVSPAEPVLATADGGRIVEATLTNEEGAEVAGSVSGDGQTWSPDGKLGYSRTYTLSVAVQREDAPPVRQQSTFSTLSPDAQTYVSMNPLDGETVGTGQPLAFYFSGDAPPPDKRAAEEAIKIRTEPAVEGAFYWFDDREVHWRPKDYWQPGTQVSVDVDVYGKKLGDGLWGQEDRRAEITIGDAVVLRADGSSHQMRVEKNGRLLRTVPIALGKPDFPSNNGRHVVTEHHETKFMDSATYGLPVEAGGYETEVQWAVRISNGGEFLHAAPWAAADLGHRNVSHGCINMTDEDAKWVYDLLNKGDVVEITNSGGPDLESWDGFGDWQVPWDEWVQGNR
ncbi:L,D-transpeptidase family protein [Saccharopolyspora sp. HNM0983]|uniref:L,D-transpeptidase family protein n=2 Tax=Saccharopolyspora montiporae TaxID=2781240 RepID=A0A929BAH6_9PSEU|nr:L,D-transpeptidase family protein [Saccharopolyspora sp. HNM0983]